MIFFNVRETRLYFLNSSEFLARKIVLFCCVLLLTKSKTSKFNLKHTKIRKAIVYIFYFSSFDIYFYEGVYPCQNCFICSHKVYDKVNDVLYSCKSRFFYRQRNYSCYHVTYSWNSNNTNETMKTRDIRFPFWSFASLTSLMRIFGKLFA